MRRLTVWAISLILAALLGTSCSSSREHSLLGRGSTSAGKELTEPLELRLPLVENSVRFAVVGDTGTGDDEQYEVGELMTSYHDIYPFEFVIMLGDNLYGSEETEDYLEKFELPYKELLSRGVKFYASLGNHDDPAQRFYKLFNMDGERYYKFEKRNVRFYALDTDYMDPEQVKWLEEEAERDDSEWEIAFFHHPLYSSGRKHGPDDELREILEPIFINHGVDAVFSGHEHFYERIHPQKGIYYFIVGAGAKLREGNISQTAYTARGFDGDRSFTLVEIVGSQMYVQTISRGAKTVDFAQLSTLRTE